MRTTGIGVNSALGRLSTVIMPFILVAVYESSTYSPFLFFSGIAALCAIMAFKLPFDTSNLKLDHVDEELDIIAHAGDTIKEEPMNSSIKSNNSNHKSPANNNLTEPLVSKK